MTTQVELDSGVLLMRYRGLGFLFMLEEIIRDTATEHTWKKRACCTLHLSGQGLLLYHRMVCVEETFPAHPVPPLP